MNSSPVINGKTSVPPLFMQAPYTQKYSNPVKRPARRKWPKVVGVVVVVLVLIYIVYLFVSQPDPEFVAANEYLIRKLTQYSNTPPTPEQCTAYRQQYEQYHMKYAGNKDRSARRYNHALQAAEQSYFSAYKTSFDQLFHLYQKMDDLINKEGNNWSKATQSIWSSDDKTAAVIASKHVALPPQCIDLQVKLAERVKTSLDVTTTIKDCKSRLDKRAPLNVIIRRKVMWDTLFGKTLSFPVSTDVCDLIVYVDAWFRIVLVEYG
uniref:Uncharacterized protein n=1 Tax=Spongospora subterranea TaxID=70186 RepID=A0A0H5RKI1_9EUKA|eukprot:CRZ09239.1 hypothetical protein [Spongospora subterranea]